MRNTVDQNKQQQVSPFTKKHALISLIIAVTSIISMATLYQLSFLIQPSEKCIEIVGWLP